MIRKEVNKTKFNSHSEIRQNLQYWLSKTPQERLAAVDFLRRQYYGDSQRLQRVARVIQQSQRCITNKRALGRKKDLADIEALGEE